MANKRAVIAVNKGGPLEIIDDYETGLLFDRNSEDLKNKIELLYHNKTFKEKIAINGSKKVEKEFNHTIQDVKIYQLFKSY